MEAISELDVVRVVILHSMCMLFALKMVSNNVIEYYHGRRIFSTADHRLFFTDRLGIQER